VAEELQAVVVEEDDKENLASKNQNWYEEFLYRYSEVYWDSKVFH